MSPLEPFLSLTNRPTIRVQDGGWPSELVSWDPPPPASSGTTPLPRNPRQAKGTSSGAEIPALSDLLYPRAALHHVELEVVSNLLLMPSATVPAIQKLYDVCRVSFSEKGPLSAEAVDNVKAAFDVITPSDVGLECEGQAVSPRALNSKRVFHSSPAIRYRHIYECQSFSIGIFCISASSIIPLHNHPGMTVLSKLLYGTVHVKSYDWMDAAEPLELSKARPAKVVMDGEMSAPCGAIVLHPDEGGNLHAVKAITPCAILDILTPPYSSEDGRHCSYFRRRPKSDASVPGVLLNQAKGSEFVWLEEYHPRDSFAIRRDLYTGPALNL